MHTLDLRTDGRDQLLDITPMVQRIVHETGVNKGAAIVYVPHTTAGVTINENADPDVRHDMLKQLDAMVPWQQPFYRHGEGNSAAHVKASMMGPSVSILIVDAKLVLGTWQGVYFCEFDGPRQRKAHVNVMPQTP